MPFQPCPNICSVQNIWTLYGETVENVHHVMKGDPWVLADLMALSAAIRVNQVTGYINELTADSVHINLTLTSLDTDSSPVYVDTFRAGDHGVGTNASLPNNVAFAITAHTAKRGRSYRGRHYVWGFDDEELDNNTLHTDKADAWVSTISHMIADVHTFSASADVCVLSRYHDKVKRAEGIGTPITSYSYHDLILDSMRRRLPHHGPKN